MSRSTVWVPLLLLLGATPSSGEKKVTLCHVPPGNPSQTQTISVGEAAVPAHVAHGDAVGACPTGCAAGCDDGNLCTTDSCGAGGECLHAPVSCDDGVV